MDSRGVNRDSAVSTKRQKVTASELIYWPGLAAGKLVVEEAAIWKVTLFECQSQLCLLSTVRSWDSRPHFVVPPLWSVENRDGPLPSAGVLEASSEQMAGRPTSAS